MPRLLQPMILLLSVVWMIPVAGCSVRIGGWKIGGPSIHGNGVLSTEERIIDEFDSVDVSGAIELEVTLGSDPSLSITADENLHEIIDAQVVDGCLEIRTTDSYSTNNPVVVKAGSIQLKKYKGSGATRGAIFGLEGDTFDVDLSGASSLKLTAGSVSKMKVDASGACTLNAPEFTVQDATVDASGASTVIIMPVEKLSASASGASTIQYIGEPNVLSKDESGASSVRAKK